MRAYRVCFDQRTKYRDIPFFMDVFANNAKEACDYVLEVLYYDSFRGHHFYPFHRHAYRISENEWCSGLRMVNK